MCLDVNRLASEEQYIVFDTETTGFNRKTDRIIELAAKKYRRRKDAVEVSDILHLYLKPPFRISGQITELTGITNDQLSGQPEEQEVFDRIAEFFLTIPVVGYNVGFDVSMLQALYRRCGAEYQPEYSVDVLKMAKEQMTNVENHKLGTVAAYLGVDKDLQFHTAIDDAEATKRVMDALCQDRGM